VRFRFDVPKSLPTRALPLRVTARLRHRSRNLSLQRLICAESRTERGRAFTAAVKERTGSALDPCLAQPVTDIATRQIAIGAVTAGPSPAPLWRRLYDHGLGELRALQEEVGDARPSLERALAELPAENASERGMVMALLASVAERQGRTEEVLAWLDRARESLGAHPALSHIRGEAFSSVWRWREAVQPLRDAALASPRDDRLWMHLALAAGSAGQPAEALDAARHALALQPRDPDCLRIQALALQTLQAPPDATERAEQAYLDFRTPDEGPRVRAACSKKVPGCANERIPVHTHALRKSLSHPL
jgi:tetratricopeptide (TPR) repeat protein